MKDITIPLLRPLSPQGPARYDLPPSTGSRFGNEFTRFVLGDRISRRYLLVAVVGTILQFFVFKLLYPFADFFSDSSSYIYAASAHLEVSMWPIGYSKFLAGFHALTHSDTALVAFQYFFLELSALYFFFTWAYFFHPGRPAKIALFIFLFFNPLFLYISNYVNSDPLFAALSVFWFAELIWIVNRPRWRHVLTQGLLVYLAFTVRNNAYIYPFIAVIAFLLTQKKSWSFKIAGSLLGPLLILPFVLHTRTAAKEMTGTAQFSLFTGWQLANNALYIYPHVSVDTNALPSPESRELDGLTRKFFSHTPPFFETILANYPGNFYIRESTAPLKRYIDEQYKIKTEAEEIVAWGQVSVIFDEYGTYLISHNPGAYLRYFMWMNTKNYLVPPLEKLAVYNLGEDHVGSIVRNWFDYSSKSVRTFSKDAQCYVLVVFPGIFLLCNIIFIGGMVWMLIRKKAGTLSAGKRKALAVMSCFLLANAAFCIFSTIVVLRYEFFPMIVTFAFVVLVIEWIDRWEKRKSLSINANT